MHMLRIRYEYICTYFFARAHNRIYGVSLRIQNSNILTGSNKSLIVRVKKKGK